MRSSWKLPYVFRGFNKKNILNKDIFYDMIVENNNCRHFIISGTLVNNEVYVYNGKYDNLIAIKFDMVGHKLGEFAGTKILGEDFRLASYKKKKKKKNKFLWDI